MDNKTTGFNRINALLAAKSGKAKLLNTGNFKEQSIKRVQELIKEGRIKFSLDDSKLKEEINKLKQKQAIENFRKSCINADIALNKEQSKQFTNHLIYEIGKITGIPKYLLTNKNKEIMKTFENGMYINGTAEKLNHLKDYALKRKVYLSEPERHFVNNYKSQMMVFMGGKLEIWNDGEWLFKYGNNFTQITSDQFFEYCDNWQKLKQPELKIGQWRKDLDGDLFRIKGFYRIEVSSLDSNEKEFINSDTILIDNYEPNYGKIISHNISNELPTSEEIRQHLINIAREKGFPVNVKVDLKNLNQLLLKQGIKSESDSIMFSNKIVYDSEFDSLYINNQIIYHQGVWVEIID